MSDAQNPAEPTTTTTAFYIISDPQVGHEVQEERLLKKRDVLLKKATKDDVVLVPGDITQYGIGNVSNPFVRYLCMCVCIRRRKGESVDRYSDELPRFKRMFMNPVEKKIGNVLLCIGNHDSLTQWWTGCNPVYEYVKRRHGGLVYEKEVAGGILVFSLSEYPDARAVSWLKDRLNRQYAKDRPFVVFFHYNLEGPYSDWWKDSEKEAFYKAIEPHKDRLAFIAVGHVHWTKLSEWRGIRVVNGAGEGLIRLTVHRDGKNRLKGVDARYMT